MNTPSKNTTTLYFSDKLLNNFNLIQKYPLTLIEAPMGYGKTVAMQEYLNKAQNDFIWVTALGSTPSVFWHSLCEAFSPYFLYHPSKLEELRHLGYPDNPAKMKMALQLLLHLSFAKTTLLVIDDIHRLPQQDENTDNSSGSISAMEILCELLTKKNIEHLHIVLISRLSTLKTRKRTVKKKQLLIIDKNTFILGVEDINAYYNQCGISLTDKEKHTLYKKTDGWISSLYLYLLHYNKYGVLAQPATITELLENEVFSHVSTKTQHFLMCVCPLECFTKEQADFLLGEDTVAIGGRSSVIDELERKNAFINYSETEKNYILHAIFREYLQSLFIKLPPEEQKTIHISCAKWFLTQNNPFSAIELFYKAEDYESILHTIENNKGKNVGTQQPLLLMQIFESCPEEVLERHIMAALLHALTALTVMNVQVLMKQLTWVGAQCAKMAAQGGEKALEARMWQGEIEFILALSKYNDLEAMSVHHRRANELLGRASSMANNKSPFTLGTPSVLFMFHRTSGKMSEEIEQMHRCVPHYYKLAAMHGAGTELIMEAEAYYQTGDFQEAEILCHQAEFKAQSYGQLDIVLCTLFLRIRLYLYNGQLKEAQDCVQNMHDKIREKYDFYLLQTVDLCKGFLYSSIGQVENIPQWICKADGTEKRLYSFAGPFYYLIHGRALLVSGQFTTLIGLFEWLLQSNTFAQQEGPVPNVFFTLYAHIFISAANAAIGRMEKAKDSLAIALDLALPDKIYMPFVENMDFLKLTFKKASTQHPKYKYKSELAKIHSLATVWEKNKRKICFTEAKNDNNSQAMLIPLTKRELHVSLLAIGGKTNAEIAEDLGITLNTVKKILSLLFRKQGLAGRHELAKLLALHGMTTPPSDSP